MTLNNVIAITAYNKPELLFINLEQLYAQKELPGHEIIIYTEEGYHPDQDSVIKYYKDKYPRIGIEQVVRRKNLRDTQVGFSNILYSYIDAANLSREYVIVLEEDIIPTKDYIRFNQDVYYNYLIKYDRIFCAAHKRRPETELQGDPSLLIADFQCTSPSIVSVNAINKYLKPFLIGNYLILQDPETYYKIMFPKSRIPPNVVTHHDGFIERVMEHHLLWSLKPDQARSMHIGLSGVCCKGLAPTGTLEERIAAYRILMKDGNKLRALSATPGDMVVTDPEGPVWDTLSIDVDRTKAKASSWWYDTNNEFEIYYYYEH